MVSVCKEVLADEDRIVRAPAARPQDRPREKLEKSGAAALGDNELLALVSGTARPALSALAVANAMLSVAGGTHGLTRASRAR